MAALVESSCSTDSNYSASAASAEKEAKAEAKAEHRRQFPGRRSQSKKERELASGIKHELLKLMENELKEWENKKIESISATCYQRELHYESVLQQSDMGNTMRLQTVDVPNMQDWKEFRRLKKLKARRLSNKAQRCLIYWSKEFERWGLPVK